MKPEQFIREYGVEKAKKVVEGAPDWATHFDLTHKDHYQVEEGEGCCLEDLDTVDLSDLKRLLASLDLVNYHGGLKLARHFLTQEFCLSESHTWNDLKQSIKDHESIYGGGDE